MPLVYANGIRRGKFETKEKELGIPGNLPFPAAVPSESSSFHMLIRRSPPVADRPKGAEAFSDIV